MQPHSISFDRAASFYDDTRGLPADVARRVGDCAADLLGAGARVLEIGVGTGRIAKPLLASGLRVTGIDLSLGMMRRLIETLPAGAPEPMLMQADATRIPLQDGVFDALVAVHVFHLIPAWQSALDEARRVLTSHGVILIGNNDSGEDTPYRRVRKQWEAFVAARGYAMDHPAANKVDFVKAAIIASGMHRDEREAVAAEWPTRHTVRRVIDDIENRIWSQTWQVPDELIPATVAEVSAWAEAEYGSLDHKFEVVNTFTWERYRS